jgi:thiol-disulfide isomerase/thioredoxin
MLKHFLKTLPFFLLLSTSSSAQNINLVKFDDLKNRVEVMNDTLYVLNFWATWCRPCIQELPYFEKIHSEKIDQPLKIILVNLDFNSKVESVAKPFVKKKKLQSEIVHITETDPNLWISKLDSNWSGAIPATIMIRNKTKLFFKEGEMSYEEIIIEISNHLTKK